ncbi:transport inhibitor response 1-like protein [Ipomoea triloba]|uniref:transport inhibitor response 1-like protein n=1 Tax=Ipomoea triloba TaxID=35885 RepID=UPI00125DFF0A|nr:transport inhibitor response 1-like protein [Ipomoea triloba]
MSSPVTSNTGALPAFPNLKELVLVCCEEFGSSGLATVACECSRKLRVVECDVKDDEMDWISCFPETKTCVESLMFDCEVNFQALEQLVMRSPCLKKLRLNGHVSIVQLMVGAPQLTNLGTGASEEEAELELDYTCAFAACKSLVVCLSEFREILAHYLPAIYPVCTNLTSLNFISAEQLKLQI